MIVVIGVLSAVLFGAAKELWDYKRNLASPNTHGVEWKDFWYTTMGGFAGGAISYGIILVAPRPIIAFTAMVAGAIYLGWDAVKCCVFNQCSC